MVLQAASDWALRRLLKVLLKRSLKHVVATELDVDQLRVSLGSGALELSDVLLSADWLAEHAPPGVEVASGYVGRLAITIAVGSLTCAVRLEDVLLTLRPSSKASGKRGATAPAGAAFGDAASGAASGAEAAAGVDDGVRLVAAGVETLLQRMTVTVDRLSVRIEGAPGSGAPAACLSCAQVSCGAAALAPDLLLAHAASTSRRVAFSGLTLAAQEGAPPLLAPLGGEAGITLCWPLDCLLGHPPHVTVAARLDAVQLPLRVPDLAALLSLGRAYVAAASQALQAQQQQQQAAAAAPLAGGALPPMPPPMPLGVPQAGGYQLAADAAAVAGHRSFLEDLLLPGCSDGQVASALAESVAFTTGQEEEEEAEEGMEDASEFHDARSMLGSLHSTFASAMSASGLAASSSAGYASAVGGFGGASGAAAGSSYSNGGGFGNSGGRGAAGGAAAAPLDLDAFTMHDLAASVREVGGVQAARWSASLAAPSLTLTLLYPEGAGCASPLFAPRLVAEALDVQILAESGDPSSSGSSSSSGGGGSLSASVGVLEVAEHLPYPHASPASSAASSPALDASGWLPAEEMARVPSLLPGARHVGWAAPTSAGDYPMPGEAASLDGISDTLAQLSSLSQAATVYQSTAELATSSMLASMVLPDSASVPRVQIVPVLRCGGQSGAALVVLCTRLAAADEGLQSSADNSSGSAAAGADVAVLLQPVSVWCTLPLLARLQAFAAPLAAQLAAAQPTAVDAQQPGSKAAVAAIIEELLQQEQQPTQQPADPPAAPLRLRLYLPAACVVVAVPLAYASLRYFAGDVRGSSSQLLASMAPRLSSQAAQALVASLHGSGVEPTILLQPGGGGGEGSAAAWACAVRLSCVAVHAVGEAEEQPGPAESVLGPALCTTQVACIEAGSPRLAGAALAIDLSWRPAGEAPGLLEELWVAAGQDAAAQPDHAALREQLSATAPLLVAVSAAAPVQLWMEQRVLVAAGRVADGLLQLSAAPPPPDAATQATLLLDCDVQCTIGVPSGAPFSLTVRSLRAVACSSPGGVAGSSVAALAVGALELSRPGDDGSGSRLLAHAAGQQLSDGRRKPALQVFAPVRPTGEPCLLCSNGRYVLPGRGRVSIAAAGLTLLLDEVGRLDWATDLQTFGPAVSGSSGGGSSGDASPWAASASGSPPSPPPAALEWAVALAGSAVRYEPKDARATAAMLTAASITWQAGGGGSSGQQQARVEARRLALHVATASGSGGSDSPGRRQTGGLAPSLADLPGFHQVAAEAGITVALPAREQQQQAGQQQAGQQQRPQETVVTNRELSVTLSRRTLLLLRSLVDQLPSRGAPAAGQPGVRSAAADPISRAGSGSLSGSVEGGSASGRPVSVLSGVVQGAYASPRRPAEHPLEASVFLDGGWYDPQAGGGYEGGDDRRYDMSPAGSPPAVVERFMEAAGAAGAAVASGDQEGGGVWYGSGRLTVREDYAALAAPPEEETATCFGSPSYAARALPPGLPPLASRLTLRDLSITVTLADTFTTVLLPEDPAEEGEDQGWGEGGGAASIHAQQGVLAGEGDEEELVPLSAQVQARLEGLCLQLDTFAPPAAAPLSAAASGDGDSDGDGRGWATQSRCALVLRHLEVRDSFQPRQGGGRGGAGGSAASAAAAAASAAATGWSDLRRTLGYHASAHRARGSRAAMVQVVVEAVCAEPGSEPEYRVQAQLLPLLLHLDQAALTFLQHFFAPAEDESKGKSGGGLSRSSSGKQAAAATSGGGDAAAAAVPAPSSSGGALDKPFFQRCEVQPFTLSVRYRSHRVDLAALRSGQLAEVLNLVPWGGVALQFRHLRLFGMQGVEGVGTALASAWVEDIGRFQAHRFVTAVAPIASICRVSSAAAQLLAIPRQQLYRRASADGAAGGLTLTALTDEDFRRQMQRGLAGFVRAVALEACNLGATVAAGAEVALAGEASASHTAGVKQALRQASAHLRSSSGPRTAATAAATAVRTALLGVRNSLDREHTLERRLNS